MFVLYFTVWNVILCYVYIFMCLAHCLGVNKQHFYVQPQQHSINDWPLSEFSIYDINFRTFMTFISIFYHQNGVFLFSFFFFRKQHEAILFVRMCVYRLGLWRSVANLCERLALTFEWNAALCQLGLVLLYRPTCQNDPIYA